MKITTSDFAKLNPCPSAIAAYIELNPNKFDIVFNRDMFRKFVKAYDPKARAYGYDAYFGINVWLGNGPYSFLYTPCRLDTKDSKKVMESKIYHAVKKYLTKELKTV